MDDDKRGTAIGWLPAVEKLIGTKSEICDCLVFRVRPSVHLFTHLSDGTV